MWLKEYSVREASGFWFIDERAGGMLIRDFHRYSTEAEAQAEADRRTAQNRANLDKVAELRGVSE